MRKYVIPFSDYTKEAVNESVETRIRQQIIDSAYKLDAEQQKCVAAFLKIAKDSDLEAMADNLANGATTVTLEAAGETAEINIPDIASDIIEESASWTSKEQLNEGLTDMIRKIGKAAVYVLGAISLGGGLISAGSMFLQAKMAIFDHPVSGVQGALAVYGGIIVAGLLFSAGASMEKPARRKTAGIANRPKTNYEHTQQQNELNR